jgi:hypothetical protein
MNPACPPRADLHQLLQAWAEAIDDVPVREALLREGRVPHPRLGATLGESARGGGVELRVPLPEPPDAVWPPRLHRRMSDRADPRRPLDWRYALEPGSQRAVAIAPLHAALPLDPQVLREQTLELIEDIHADWDELCVLSWLDSAAPEPTDEDLRDAARARAALHAFWHR